MRVDDLISDPATYADPPLVYSIFAKLRAEDPVRWMEPQNYRPFWAVTKYDDVVEIERQRDIFINAPRSMLQTHKEEAELKKRTGGAGEVLETVVHMDGENHLAHRDIAKSFFTPAAVRRMEGIVNEIATEFIDRLVEKDGAAEFCEEVAVVYPLRVIMSFLGVPGEDAMLLVKYAKMHTCHSDESVAQGRSPEEVKAASEKALFAYFAELIERRRKNPGDDLVSTIAMARPNGKPISERAALSYCFLLAVAGHDTTSMASSGGLLAFIENPGEIRKLRQSPQLLGHAVNEVLRWSSPVKHFFRTAVKDYALRGRDIKAGQAVFLSYPSANRDEDIFDSPDQFRIDRSPNNHLAFGSGAHICLGMHLARLELAGLYRVLFSRIDELSLAGDPEWYKATSVAGLKSLPIAYKVRKAAAVPA